MQALGRDLAGELTNGGVIGLDGELGAGKTELVKGLAAGVGHAGPVTSPTFTLLHEYRMGVRTLYHFDFYRVERAEDILRLGWDDLVEESGSILAVEWASRFPELLPEGALRVNLQILPGEARRVTRVT
jgi:tRNA threonylcarbamoyladenosine biosynthesis protein TsaE|tara:strand:- start:739 stop:1125 length:387 start_codon:yes stop_codon:yes gene_type:complete